MDSNPALQLRAALHRKSDDCRVRPRRSSVRQESTGDRVWDFRTYAELR